MPKIMRGHLIFLVAICLCLATSAGSPLSASARATSHHFVTARPLVDGIGRYGHGFESASIDKSYGVVAIVGCQGSGKSTLLNALFGTTFPVRGENNIPLGASIGRRTTKGAWLDLWQPALTESHRRVVSLSERTRGGAGRPLVIAPPHPFAGRCRRGGHRGPRPRRLRQ